MPPKKDNTNEATKALEATPGPELGTNIVAGGTEPVPGNDGIGVAAGESQAPGDVPGTGEGGTEPNTDDTSVQGNDESAGAVHIGDSLGGPDSASTGDSATVNEEAVPISAGIVLDGDDSVPAQVLGVSGIGSGLNGAGNVEPTAGSEAGDQSQPEQGGDDDTGADPDANPNTGERDESRLSRGLDDDVELKEPEEEPEAVAPDSMFTLRYAEVWTQINELQKLIDGTGIQLVVDSYQQTAKVIVPEYATLPAQFEGLKLAQ